MFTPVQLIGVVGQDFPKNYKKLLEQRAVDISGLEVRPGKTFRWTGEFGQNLGHVKTLSTCLNVFTDFRPRLLPQHRDQTCIFLANIDPELQMEVLSQIPRRKWIACDTMRYWIESKKEVLKELFSQVDIIFLNDEELHLLTEEPNLYRAGRSLARWGPKTVVIKKGEHGCLLFSHDQWHAFPAYPVENPMDPTGAGDSFAGGFLGFLASLEGEIPPAQMRRAAAYGTILGSFTVEAMGTEALERLDSRKIEKRFQDYVRMLALEDSSLSKEKLSLGRP